MGSRPTTPTPPCFNRRGPAKNINFDFMADSYVKNVWGFAKESTINKSLLDTALATYANAVY